MLVAVLPEALERFGEVWRSLSGDWVAIFAEDSEDELAFLLRHMNRTVELGHRQIARLASGDV
ncbi:hypothetical protein ACH4E7_30270 [Kitasatospora sp. NPDC018058]|uniref:hypothetical protein n=1 Tax=Kitasatospora sp. NPDC018058 TaxID=3364025 RepID=UPI0037BED3F9